MSYARRHSTNMCLGNRVRYSNGHVGLAALIEAGRVQRMVCSFPRSSDAGVFIAAYRRGAIELDVVPQGTLAERMRAAGAGIPAFFTPTSVGTPLAKDKEVREFNGRSYVIEHALSGDVALVKADQADRFGNLTYHRAARNFGRSCAWPREPPSCRFASS